MLYIALPSYLLLSLHRGFLPNAFALSLLPLAILGAHRVLTGKQHASSLAFFALSFSAIILTQRDYGLPLRADRGVDDALLSAARWLARHCALIRRHAAGAGAYAFFWGPQLTEMKWVQIGLQVLQQDYHHYFLFAPPPMRAASAGAGRHQLLGSLIILMQSSFVLALGLPSLWKASHLRRAPLVWFSLALALAGLVISLRASDIVWRYLPG